MIARHDTIIKAIEASKNRVTCDGMIVPDKPRIKILTKVLHSAKADHATIHKYKERSLHSLT